MVTVVVFHEATCRLTKVDVEDIQPDDLDLTAPPAVQARMENCVSRELKML